MPPCGTNRDLDDAPLAVPEPKTIEHTNKYITEFLDGASSRRKQEVGQDSQKRDGALYNCGGLLMVVPCEDNGVALPDLSFR